MDTHILTNDLTLPQPGAVGWRPEELPRASSSGQGAWADDDDCLQPTLLNTRIVLVGLGLHAKRIYIYYCQRHSIFPALIVELESRRDEVEAYLRVKGRSTTVLYIPDQDRDNEALSPLAQEALLRLIRELSITHAIISTEPKAHLAYLQFFLSNDINTLCDKPITAPSHVSTQVFMARKIWDDYALLCSLYTEARTRAPITCQVQCQRRWHAGYLYIRRLLRDCVRDYGIPITTIEIYHCDGMWNMPDEFLLRENHPYKYGYGKLFHSGYHFIDLMCWLEAVNAELPRKRANSVELYATATRPSDYMGMIDGEDYRRLLATAKFDPIFQDEVAYNFHTFGEVDFYSLAQFKRDGRVITTCSLNLLQNGFCRRSWVDLPVDTYKGNGRVRHERVNIQVGPLMNIQIHSYQSKEIKERDSGDDVGSVEHFDIYVFRNTALIGGEPFEKIPLCSLTEGAASGFIGFNEQAREACMLRFLGASRQDEPDLLDHELTIKMLSSAYVSLCNRADGRSPVVTFSLEQGSAEPAAPSMAEMVYHG